MFLGCSSCRLCILTVCNVCTVLHSWLERSVLNNRGERYDLQFNLEGSGSNVTNYQT